MKLSDKIRLRAAVCIMAILAIALCGCDDLGAYENKEEYYGSFGDIVMIEGTSREKREYSVSDYFYNESSREDFLTGDDGVYSGVEHSDYVYMAIPFASEIDMDTLALYIQSKTDVTVYMNVYVADKIPSEWKSILDLEAEQGGSDDETTEGDETTDGSDTTEETKVYDDPAPETRIGEITIHLKGGQWSSFAIDEFRVGGVSQKSIQIKEGQYILLQIRNNSGVRIFNEEKQVYVDPQSGLVLERAEITLTNLLVRALDVKSAD